MRSDRDPRLATLVVAGSFILALLVGLWIVRPVTVAPVGPDAAAPVIAWERLVAGQRLEGYLSQTSKPLLTLVYGIAYSISGDFRAISIVAILSFAALVAAATRLAIRLSGFAAAGFVAVGIAWSAELLRDVGLAYGVSWALLAGAVAGLAVTAERPRFGIAGLALAAGALARPELLAVTALAVAVVAVTWLASRSARFATARRPPAAAWLLGLGFLAIPILAIHDSILTGDPVFWLNTAAANSEGARNVRGLAGTTVFVARHVIGLAPLVVLGGLAVLDLALQKRWRDLVIVAITPLAVALFFIAVGGRGTVITSRYLIPIDIALVVTAGIGVGSLRVPRIVDWLAERRLRPRAAELAGALGAGLLALAIAPTWFSDPAVRPSVLQQRAKAENLGIAIRELRPLLAAVPDWRAPGPAPKKTMVILPARFRAQAVVDLDLPLWAGTKASPGLLRFADGLPQAGTIVYHDRLDDEVGNAFAALEVTQPTVVGRVRIVPLFVDARRGIWIDRVEDAAT